MRIRGISFFKTTLFLTLSFSLQAFSASDLKKIIGDNDLTSVSHDGSNLPPSLREAIHAIGLIKIDEKGACTATHLGNGFVLTAGHCFLDESNPAPQMIINRPCGNTQVFWGYRETITQEIHSTQTALISQCTSVVFAELSKQRDFAVFKIDLFPRSTIAISSAKERTAINTKITILSHPRSRPLEWSQYCSVQPKSVIPPSAKSPHTPPSPSEFAHQCDTEPGSSGSAILSTTVNGSLKIIGVHNGSSPVNYNYGTYIYDVRMTLKKRGFDLDQWVSNSPALALF